MKPTAWELYHSMFKDGEDVVLIDEWDRAHCGKLKTTARGAWIKPPIGKREFLEWEWIRFMAHDGFPVRKLFGADGSKLIEKLDTTETQALIRGAFGHHICGECGSLMVNEDLAPYMHEDTTCEDCLAKDVVFGDPFHIENVHAQLLFPGNYGPEFWDEDGQEVLVMKAKDGAMAQLYMLDTIYWASVA